MKTLTQIALIEPFDHSEVLYVLCELLLEQEVELQVFCQAYIFEDCPETLRANRQIQWHPFTAHNRKKFFLQQQERFHRCQLLIWITAPPAAYAWINRLRLQAPVVLLLHNLHTWLIPWSNLQLSKISAAELFSDLARLLRFALQQRPQQRRLLKKIKAVGVPSQNMLRLVKEFSRSGKMPEAFFVPFTYNTERVRSGGNEGTAEILIPGVVSRNGRDYQLVADGLADALPYCKRPVHLVLLGKATEMSTIRPLKELESKHPGFSLTYFTERLPQKTYDEYLKKAHFMILPFEPYQRFGIIRERWGVSKISGGISDMIRFGIPAICSAHYQLDPEVRSLTSPFSTGKELAALLIDWVNQQVYLNHRLAAKGIDKSALSARLFLELSRLIQ